MSPPKPHHTVLHPTTLPSFLHHLLTLTSTPHTTTLIICTSRSTFEQQLLLSLQKDPASPSSSILTPTLHNLTATSALRTLYCTSLPALRALLSNLTHNPQTTGVSAAAIKKEEEAAAAAAAAAATTSSAHPTIALLNPLALHAPTPSFSAQGLSRTLAAAVDAAHATGARLLMAECPFATEPEGNARGNESNVQGHEADIPLSSESQEEEEEEEEENQPPQDPWSADLPLLNAATTRRAFGGAGNGGWVGRRVQARRVVAQWFVFAALGGDHDDDHDDEEEGREGEDLVMQVVEGEGI